eukprot:122890-Alexandrium_andersonii.AAC.2
MVQNNTFAKTENMPKALWIGLGSQQAHKVQRVQQANVNEPQDSVLNAGGAALHAAPPMPRSTTHRVPGLCQLQAMDMDVSPCTAAGAATLSFRNGKRPIVLTNRLPEIDIASTHANSSNASVQGQCQPRYCEIMN